MAKWLITGPEGFLGSRLADYYKEKYEVAGAGHKDLDITDADSVLRYMESIRPAVVIHCAAISSTGLCQEEPELSERVNYRGTVNLAAACAKTGSRLVFMSSDQIYAGNTTGKPNREEEEYVVNVYGRHKRQAELEALSILPETVCLRLPWMYDFPIRGKKSGSGLLNNLLKALVRNEPVKLPVHDYRGITWAYEVIEKVEAAAGLPGGVYNFGSGNERSTYETAVIFLHTLLGNQDRDGLLIPDEERFADRERNLTMDTGKIAAHKICFPDTAEGFNRCLRKNPEYVEAMIQ